MAAAEDWAKRRRLEQVVLHTWIDRADARAFYAAISEPRLPI